MYEIQVDYRFTALLIVMITLSFVCGPANARNEYLKLMETM